MHSSNHWGGKCITFSTLTPPPVSWASNEIQGLALYAAEELAAIALGEEPVWILESQGGNFLGRVLIQDTSAGGKFRGIDTDCDEKKEDGPATETVEASEWVKDVAGWRCIRSTELGIASDEEQGSLLSVRPMVWMVGVCEEHRRRVEVLIEVMN